MFSSRLDLFVSGGWLLILSTVFDEIQQLQKTYNL